MTRPMPWGMLVLALAWACSEPETVWLDEPLTFRKPVESCPNGLGNRHEEWNLLPDGGAAFLDCYADSVRCSTFAVVDGAAHIEAGPTIPLSGDETWSVLPWNGEGWVAQCSGSD